MLVSQLFWRTLQYLQQALGREAVREGAVCTVPGLPAFLEETYEFATAELHGQAILVACVKGPQAPPARHMGRHVQQLRERSPRPVILALPQVTPGERRQLITHGLAFVVPGSQFYAPRLGMILSERFPAANQREASVLSPATQAMLIGFLLRAPETERWQPSADAVAMGYTAMTATRAVRELLPLGLFKLDVQGRSKYLRRLMAGRQLWDRARLHLSSPVQRTLWTYDPRILQRPDVRTAGMSALAQRSMLNEPPAPVIAITAGGMAQAARDGVDFEPRALADAIEVQVWRYPPTMAGDDPGVDPLSLWLSLADHPDPRVRMALDEVQSALPW